MNDQQRNGENGRNAANWLSDLARVYGAWHLAVTILQGALWAGFVFWNEIGGHPTWRDTLQASASLVWQALPAFSITSAAILVAAQKGGRILLTFIDERRQRIAKARAEGVEVGRAEGVEEGIVVGREEGRVVGREEGRKEGREEGRAEGREEGWENAVETLSQDPRIAAILRENPRIRESPDRKNGGG